MSNDNEQNQNTTASAPAARKKKAVTRKPAVKKAATKRKVAAKKKASGTTSSTASAPSRRASATNNGDKKKIGPRKPVVGKAAKAKNGTAHNASVVIVGAGFAGLGMAIRLRQAGVDDFVLLERADNVGGTWRDNTYPGAACDIPSHLYSYSFAPNPYWSRHFSGSAEILDYIEHLVKQYGLRDKIRFQQDVTEASFDETKGQWRVDTRQGDIWRARAVVMAQGPLSNASFPDIEGLDTFKGKRIHSARWDHDFDFSGKRVAVIGTGASAVQIIPELAKTVGTLKVFQRTPAWVIPRRDYATPDWNKALFEKLPLTRKAMRQALYWTHETMALAVIWNSPLTRLAERLSLMHLRSQVKDDWMRRQLTPDFRIGCKRVLLSNDYYPALQKDNVDLITWPVARIAENGIRTCDGIEHQFDCIVFATGFDVPKSGTPFPIRGLNGRELGEEWSGGARAYKSVSVAGYPNLFFTFGPNSGPGHNSALVYMEAQLDYAVTGIQRILDHDLKILDVRESVQQRHNHHLQKRLARTNWNSGCKSWYLTEDGYNATMYPGFASQYRRQMARFVDQHYRRVPQTGSA